MQHRLNKVNSANGRPGDLGDNGARVSFVDNATDNFPLEISVSPSEVQRSQRDVYQKVRLALNHPVSWYVVRARRAGSAYCLPIMWAGMGCVCGLGIAMFHQLLTPTVKLPTRQEMNAVFTLHDLNELLIASHPQIRSKS
jgi:hypothetical protein